MSTTAKEGVNPVIQEITDRIDRAQPRQPHRLPGRIRPRRRGRPARGPGPGRSLGCANLAHGFAAAPAATSRALRGTAKPGVAIVTSYNDMLSAHQPYETYPAELKAAVRAAGGVAQVAGGVPAMCDGITQGRAGMELSLYSRDVIAMATAIALSHDMFDASLLLGVCDKIVPGLLIGALHFGHLPAIFVPGRADDLGPAQQGQGPHPAALRRGQGRQRRAARRRGEVLPLPRHLHLLRHRQLQPGR